MDGSLAPKSNVPDIKAFLLGSAVRICSHSLIYFEEIIKMPAHLVIDTHHLNTVFTPGIESKRSVISFLSSNS